MHRSVPPTVPPAPPPMSAVASIRSHRPARELRSALAVLVLAAACGTADAVGPMHEGDSGPGDEGGPVTPAPGPGPLAFRRLHVAPSSPAGRQATLWRDSRPTDAAVMDRLAAQPVATWLNEWTGDVTASVSATVAAAATTDATPVFVAYNIPHRDCGSHSAGGSSSADAYRSWIRGFAAGLRGRPSVIILEPDAVAGATCLTTSQQDERFALLREAVHALSDAGGLVYVDAGHPRWLSLETAASRLARAGIDRAQGFALNVSNFVGTAENVAYGDALSGRVGGKRYVIDTSRNGLGPAGGDAWCNPAGRGLGASPTTRSAHPLVDALLWVKVPGESDGPCNGGPAAGAWWPDYALGLAQNAGW